MWLPGCYPKKVLGPILVHFFTPSNGFPFNLKFDSTQLVTYTALQGLSPAYIAKLLILHSTIRSLRSSDQSLLSIPWSSLKSKAGGAFIVLVSSHYYHLPQFNDSAGSVIFFKQQLKMYFYTLAILPSCISVFMPTVLFICFNSIFIVYSETFLSICFKSAL